MAEPSRTQLQMMLVQQSGPGALPLSIIPPKEFLPFLRSVESLALEERLNPVMVYWSRQSAPRLLPEGPRYGELIRDAFYVAIFSEERMGERPDEWCMLMESQGLCLVVYGQEALESPDLKYQCTGSMDPRVVSQAFNTLLPVWQGIDMTESNRLEDARVNLGPCGSAPPYVKRMKAAWPVVKAPIQQSLLLEVAQSPQQWESGPQPYQPVIPPPVGDKIQPIAFDPSGSQPVFTPPSPAVVTTGNYPVVTPGMGGNGPNGPNGPIGTDGKGVPGGQPPQPPQPQFVPPAITPNEMARRSQTRLQAMKQEEEQQPVIQQIIPHAAQAIISDIIGQLRHSSDLYSILQYAIHTLTDVVKAERGLIWQVVGDQLAVTNEYAVSEHACFAGNQLNSQESTAIVLEFLGRFPDETGAGVITIPDTGKDTQLHKMSPTLSSLIELGEVKARLMVQLRSRGIFSGFLELQQCSTREWTADDAVVLQRVAEVLSVVVQQSFDQSKIEMDAKEMKLINEIASLFRESRGQGSQESLVKSIMLVSDHMGFVKSQIYLYRHEEAVLEPQIQDGNGAVDLTQKDNPFVAVFESGRGRTINMEYSRKKDPFFGHDMALVLPLVSEGSRLGVIGLWQRQPSRPQFRPQDRELGLTIAGHLSNVIRADQAIQQIRADQQREALINKVSSEIRQSLKEVDQIMETLVESLRDYFKLSACMASLFDSQTNEFTKPKIAGDLGISPVPELDGEQFATSFTEKLVKHNLEELSLGQAIFLKQPAISEILKDEPMPAECRAVVLVPLVHAGNFKAALCMVLGDRKRPLPEKDMKMVTDLADRVAVVVSHAELFAQVERQAVTDPMTGLYNRRYFQEQLSKEIDRFQRFGHPFSFIIVDLDYLKKINDTLGHHFGDAAIKHIANVIKRNVRDVDTVGRFGGEEFVVLLPETDLKWARMVSERICAAIREKPVDGVGTITASLGVAVFPHDAQDKDKLFELADQALFLAKHRGRNQVCSVTEDLMPSLEGDGEQMLKSAKQAEAASRYTRTDVPLPGMKTYNAEDAEGAPITAFDLDLIAEKGILGMFAQIIRALEEKDGYGSERSPRVYGYASKIAQALHLSKEHSEVVSLAAVLSNLGKIKVDEEILKKPEALSGEEREAIEKVPTIGAKILEPAKLLHRVSSIIEAFHEHWDGTGYPNGVGGDTIPVEARIIALVDAYTAMTSDRPYRKAMSHQDAIKEIQSGSGKKYDPRLVKVFVTILQKEHKS